jgi:hypothetical protein
VTYCITCRQLAVLDLFILQHHFRLTCRQLVVLPVVNLWSYLLSNPSSGRGFCLFSTCGLTCYLTLLQLVVLPVVNLWSYQLSDLMPSRGLNLTCGQPVVLPIV